MREVSSKSSYYYMDIRLDFGEEYSGNSPDMGINVFKYAILQALKNLYGDMGYIIPVDILKYREEDRRAFIRVLSKDTVKLWSSLTLFSNYNGMDCMFRVYKVTPVLACLNLNSNLYKHIRKEKCS